MTDRSTSPLRRAMKLCQRHVIAAAGFSALVNLLYLAPTIYMLQVYDRVVPTQGRLTLLFLTIALILALFSLSSLDHIRARLLTRAGVALDTALAPMILDATIGRPDSTQAGQALRDFDQMRQTLTGTSIIALFDAPWIPIYVVVCFLVHPLIGVVALLGGTILPLLAWLNARATRSKLETAQIAASSSYAAQDAILNRAEAVRALGMRRALVARQLRQRERMLNLQMTASFSGGFYVTFTKFVRLALQSLALGLGALLAIDNAISAGAIFASSFLIARALAPIEQLMGSWRGLVQARTSYVMIDRLLASSQIGTAHTQLPPPRGSLALENVSILNAARDAMVVADANFSLKPGEVLAIVGPSGAGKSTLLRAIAGAFIPDRGAIRLDGTDQIDWDRETLANHIGYLPQDSVLFAGTVKENICRFASELSADIEAIDAEVVAAAQKVGAHELIQRLPGGYDYRLKLGGRGLSAGQAQRIALARAAFGNPSLLILDEPNAHLDADGDAQLVNTLARLKSEKRTIVIVSHKQSVLPVVDTILVLREGRIEMIGPRDAVLPKIASSSLRVAARSGEMPRDKGAA